jgi:sorting nexin-5/6/32
MVDFGRFLTKVSDYFEVARKTEGRISSDTDLKLSDILRYYARDSKAALDLLYRRTRRLADFELENKNLEKARQKHKDEKAAEQSQQLAKDKFEQISELAKSGEQKNEFIYLFERISFKL